MKFILSLYRSVCLSETENPTEKTGIRREFTVCKGEIHNFLWEDPVLFFILHDFIKKYNRFSEITRHFFHGFHTGGKCTSNFDSLKQ